MWSRRLLLTGIAATSALKLTAPTYAQDTPAQEELLAPLDYPPLDAIFSPQLFGLRPPDKAQRDSADAIIASMPTGPRPIDIAKEFVTRYATSNPKLISQWPLPEAWNPLIVHFFEATSDRVANDTVAWCAAFMNWCLERSHRPFTNSASTQTFATTTLFKETSQPAEGDIVVFTCYDNSGRSVGIGHVTFFEKMVDSKHMLCLGGNQSGTYPSIISEKVFPTEPFASRRHVAGVYVPVTYAINKFLTVV